MPIHGQWPNPGRTRCWGKYGFRLMWQAEREAARVSRKLGELVIAYECPDCRRYHVGHADKTQVMAHEAITAKKRGTRPYPLNSRLADLPTTCAHCGEAISQERREASARARNPTVYCSSRCQKNYNVKKRRARKRAEGEAAADSLRVH